MIDWTFHVWDLLGFFGAATAIALGAWHQLDKRLNRQEGSITYLRADIKDIRDKEMSQIESHIKEVEIEIKATNIRLDNYNLAAIHTRLSNLERISDKLERLVIFSKSESDH